MSKFKWDNLILFVEQLASASALKLPLDKAIRAMSVESPDQHWKKAQESVSELVELGSPLSEAMGNYPQYFPVLLRRLVRVGEDGNVMPAVLASVSRYLQSAREIQHRLQKCLIYPFLVWTVLLIEFAVLFTFVLPKFESMLSENGVGRSVFHSVNFSVSALILGSGLLFFLAWLIVGWLGSDVEERRGSTPLADRVVSNTPLLGTLHRHAKAAEACEILGILVEKGHSAREAIAVAKNAVAGPSLLSALEDVETAIVAGETYTVGEKKSLIPQTTLWMLSIAPENHEMGPALRSLAEYHRRQIEILSGFIREILEPLLLLVVAVLGGLAIIAFYSSTIFQISLFQLI